MDPYPGADGGTQAYELPDGSYSEVYGLEIGEYYSDVVIAGPYDIPGSNSGCDERHSYVYGVSSGCRSGQVRIPSALAGDYYVHVYTAEDHHSPEDGITYYDARTVPGTFRIGNATTPTSPDLRVDAPSLSHSSRSPGQSFTLSVAVRNRGDAAADATTLRYYQSPNTSISGADTEVGTDRVGGLSAGGRSSESISLTAPNASGTQYYGACVDSVSGESDTDNNCSTGVALRVGDDNSDGGDDHGDSESDATRVGPNSSTSGQLEQGGDRDFFRIEVSETGALVVQTTGNVDTLGSLTRHSDGRRWENDDSGAGSNFRISVEDAPAATYYVEVRGYSSSSTGAYRLEASFTPAEGGGAQPGANEYALPLFLSASRSRQQGFVRVINRSNQSGTVRIHAIDDSGSRQGPVSLSLAAKATAHFNSTDLERGNSSKGLSGSTGSGRGDWRLLLDTDLDITPLGFVRTSDGFLTSLHDVVAASGGRHHVQVFNPGSNYNQRSWLRLVNAGDRAAEVTISGLDDRGASPPQGDVRLTLAAGEARAITAPDLETGASGLRGRFGDGSGKWQLFVSADRPIQVMSLMETPTGSITNLSSHGVERTSPIGAASPIIMLRAKRARN